jgi:hypothetical protein
MQYQIYTALPPPLSDLMYKNVIRIDISQKAQKYIYKILLEIILTRQTATRAAKATQIFIAMAEVL